MLIVDNCITGNSRQRTCTQLRPQQQLRLVFERAWNHPTCRPATAHQCGQELQRIQVAAPLPRKINFPPKTHFSLRHRYNWLLLVIFLSSPGERDNNNFSPRTPRLGRHAVVPGSPPPARSWIHNKSVIMMQVRGWFPFLNCSRHA